MDTKVAEDDLRKFIIGKLDHSLGYFARMVEHYQAEPGSGAVIEEAQTEARRDYDAAEAYLAGNYEWLRLYLSEDMKTLEAKFAVLDKVKMQDDKFEQAVRNALLDQQEFLAHIYDYVIAQLDRGGR